MTKLQTPDVIVVGAGLAGLCAALCVHQAGKRVVVLEASSQIGGRIQAITDDKNTPLGDLGPTWVWPKYQPIAARWLDRLGLQTFDQFDQGDGILDGYSDTAMRYHLPTQDGITRIGGGPTSAIDAVADLLGRYAILLNTSVTGIVTTPSSIEITTATDQIFTASQVILATPLRTTVETITIPDMPKSLTNAMANAPTWMATQAKAVAIYPTSFWRFQGLSGRVASQTGPLMEIHDHCPITGDVGALFGFVGWDGATRAADPSKLRQAILDQLIRCFGPDAAHPSQLIIQDWANEPNICSQRDLATPPQHPDVGPTLLRSGHLNNRLWLAVSETADQSPGLIEGAFAAGESAAQHVLQQLS